MYELAKKYVARHGERHAAALDFTLRLADGEYEVDDALEITKVVFDLDDRETWRIVSALTGRMLAERHSELLEDDDGSGVVE